MFLGDRSSIAQIASCCATLYLTRSNPELLKQLVSLFAEKFPSCRAAIMERIAGRHRCRRKLLLQRQAAREDIQATPPRTVAAAASLAARRVVPDELVVSATPTNIERTQSYHASPEPRAASEASHALGCRDPSGDLGKVSSPPASSAATPRAAADEDESTSLSGSSMSSIDHLFRQSSSALLDKEDVIEYFLSIVHRLVTQYFSYNWHHVQRVLDVNRQYIEYVERELLTAVLSSDHSAAVEGDILAGGALSQSKVVSSEAFLQPSGSEVGASSFSRELTRDAASFEELVQSPLPPPPLSDDRAVLPQSLFVPKPTPRVNTCTPVSSGSVPLALSSFLSDTTTPAGQTASPNLTDGLAHVAPFVEVQEESLEEICRRCDEMSAMLVLFFHAPFSQPSCTMWSVLEAVQGKTGLSGSWASAPADIRAKGPVVVGVVHGVAEIQLVRDFHVSWFPTLIMIPRGRATLVYYDLCEARTVFCSGAVGAGMAATATMNSDCAVEPHQLLVEVDGVATTTRSPDVFYYRYPEKGLVVADAVGEWLLGEGRVVARQRRFKAWITRLTTLSVQQKFKPFRELHSVCVMLKRLQQGCSATQGTDSSSSPAIIGCTAEATSDDPPMFVFLGGGMAAGKTTAATALARSEWWQRHKETAVVVDADAFKAADPLANRADDVHRKSTKDAEQLLVHALNQGRSVIFDGTMMWAPFVEQTIAMIRRAHEYTFSMGAGFDAEKGVEEYWVRSAEPRRHPLGAAYRIVLLAITVEPGEAVPRGILRALSTGRTVPVNAQLRSFRLFSTNFESYIKLCDSVTLYNNNVRVDLDNGELPPVILRSNGDQPSSSRSPTVESRGVVVEDPHAYDMFLRHKNINEHAGCVEDIYQHKPHHQ